MVHPSAVIFLIAIRFFISSGSALPLARQSLQSPFVRLKLRLSTQSNLFVPITARCWANGNRCQTNPRPDSRVWYKVQHSYHALERPMIITMIIIQMCCSLPSVASAVNRNCVERTDTRIADTHLNNDQPLWHIIRICSSNRAGIIRRLPKLKNRLNLGDELALPKPNGNSRSLTGTSFRLAFSSNRQSLTLIVVWLNWRQLMEPVYGLWCSQRGLKTFCVWMLSIIGRYMTVSMRESLSLKDHAASDFTRESSGWGRRDF